MHLLQVLDGDRNLRTRRTIRLFAAEHAHGNVLVGVRRVREPGDNVPWGQATFLAIDSSFVEISWKPRRHAAWDPARTGYRYGSEPAAEDCVRGGGLLFGCKLLPDFLGNGLLHLRR